MHGVERLLGRIGYLVAVSASEERCLRDELPSAKILLARSGIDYTNLANHAPSKSGALSLVFSGRMTYQKNPLMFHRVANALLESFPDLRVFMMGAGYHDRFSSEIRAAIESSGMGHRFKVIDWLPRDEGMELVSSASVFVSTSRFESFGYAVAEAMAGGVPVVATRVAGIMDLVEDGETGFLVGVDDHKGLMEKIAILLQDAELRRRMGNRARKRIREHFDIHVTNAELNSVYSQLSHGFESQWDRA
jgi:glycosyltransferase involved in cell wall biosynthesis